MVAMRVLLSLVLIAATAAPADDCPPARAPQQPTIVEDYSSGAIVIPKPSGRTYDMPDTFGMFDKATWNYMFYNGMILDRLLPSESDSVILHKTFVQEVRKQLEVKNLV